MEKRILFSDLLANFFREYPIGYIDVGARGDISEPWISMQEDQLRVYGFEPDEKEASRLNEQYKGRRIYSNFGLWNKEGIVNIHLAQVPSTSSVHPPNFSSIMSFEDQHWAPRITQNKTEVKCSTLDSICLRESIDCDFIKIDTQGSEYEILEGANECLKKEAIGVLIETWTFEVHSGQHLMGEILSKMNAMGFSLFDYNPGALWYRKTSKYLLNRGKPQIIGFDLLFLRDAPDYENENKTIIKGIKKAAIAEIFGYPDYAIEIIESLETRKISSPPVYLAALKSAIIENWSSPNKGDTSFAFIKKSIKFLTGLMGLTISVNKTPNGRPVKSNYLH